MKVTVKTLKGGRFVVDAEPTSTIAEVKATIEASQSELPADKMKLIHSGRILKDTDVLESCDLKPDDFLVVMVTKAKSKPAAAPAPAAAAPATATTEAPASAPAPTSAPAPAPASSSSSSTTETPAAAPAPASAAAAAQAPAASGNEFPSEVVSNLTGMGFPESMVLACLRAAQGNPDMAMEFLTNGIPPGLSAQSEGGSSSATSSGSASGSGSSPRAGSGAPLEALRNHPQFDALRRLVQSNPQALQAVLAQIGQQQPELLQEINANQAAFLRMMNEPISEQRSTESSASGPAPAPTGGTGGSTGGGAGNLPAGLAGALGGAGGGLPLPLMEGLTNPQQVAQMLQSMGPAELQNMAQLMGVTPDQLRTSAQMLGAMQPEQLQQLLAMGGAGGLPGMGGLGGPGGPGGAAGSQVVRLSEDDVAAVNRLADLGFDRTEATQAYLACDRNEALAANLLMDGGFGFDDADGGGGGGGSGGGGGGGGGDGGDDTDKMYD